MVSDVFQQCNNREWFESAHGVSISIVQNSWSAAEPIRRGE
jgi:hypothetical protein